MTRRRIHRALTPLFVATYVLASTCAGLWHDHAPHTTGHACGHDCAGADPAHDLDSGVHEQDSDHQSCDEGLSSATEEHSSDHDGCTVCRFLALNLLAVQPVELTAGGQLALMLGDRQPQHFALPRLGTQHSRAPPALV